MIVDCCRSDKVQCRSDSALSSRRIFPRLLLNSSSVLRLVVNEQLVCFRLSRTIRIRIIQQILDSDQNLFESNRWTPALFFVQNGQTNGSRWINIGMKERRHEFACSTRMQRRFREEMCEGSTMTLMKKTAAPSWKHCHGVSKVWPRLNAQRRRTRQIPK